MKPVFFQPISESPPMIAGKVKVKVSGCFRTDDGAREYLRIMSFIGTARKHGKNAYEAIVHALSGDLDYIFC